MAKKNISIELQHYLDCIVESNIIQPLIDDREVQPEELESAIFYIQAKLTTALLNKSIKL
jgi:hypothetical protein